MYQIQEKSMLYQVNYQNFQVSMTILPHIPGILVVDVIIILLSIWDFMERNLILLPRRIYQNVLRGMCSSEIKHFLVFPI